MKLGTIIQAATMALTAGCIAGLSMDYGARITEDELLHVERFVAETIDGEGFYGEPVERNGYLESGEGVFFDVAHVPITVNEGDIVDIYWTKAQADNGDWATPAKIEEVE